MSGLPNLNLLLIAGNICFIVLLLESFRIVILSVIPTNNGNKLCAIRKYRFRSFNMVLSCEAILCSPNGGYL